MLKNKKIPWWEPQIGSSKERKLIEQVLLDNYANEGKITAEFEKRFAALVGAKYALATTSGTVAIFLALKAIGVGAGDEVIVPDATFIATANAVTMTGAEPVLVDINLKDLNINVEDTKKAITQKTKAIVPVHVTGRPANMEAIIELAKNHNIAVIEDAAEALMSKYKKKFLGTWGVAGCFSFSAAKTITTGQGGMVVTDNKEVYLKLKLLKDQGRPTRGTGGDDIHDTIGFNFKFTDIQAALGLGQLDLISRRIERMKRTYNIYCIELSGIPGFSIFDIDIKGGLVPQWTDALTEKRNELDAYLKKFNIDCRRYWFPIHKQKAYFMNDNKFPNSTRYMPKSLWLPSAFTLTDKDILFVCGKVKEFFKAEK